MIERELLIQLGWSDELIAEVTRTASDINRKQPVLPMISQPVAVIGPCSSDSIYYNSDQSDTTDQLISR